MKDPYAPSTRRFKRETKNHEMTVLLDQGLHRHLHFAVPGRSEYWFDLITVPGALIFQGDGESYVFRRLRDMFEFFRSNPDRNVMRINPHYWSEKLTDGRDRVKVYSPDVLKQHIKDLLADAREWGDRPRGLVKAVREEILQSDEIDYEESARALVRDFEFYADEGDRYKPDKKPDFVFSDTWEWDLRDYDWWFLWACHAIVWGIGRYDAARSQGTAANVPAVVTLKPVGGVL